MSLDRLSLIALIVVVAGLFFNGLALALLWRPLRQMQRANLSRRPVVFGTVVSFLLVGGPVTAVLAVSDAWAEIRRRRL